MLANLINTQYFDRKQTETFGQVHKEDLRSHVSCDSDGRTSKVYKVAKPFLCSINAHFVMPPVCLCN